MISIPDRCIIDFVLETFTFEPQGFMCCLYLASSCLTSRIPGPDCKKTALTMMAVLATPAARMARRSTGRCVTFMAGSRKDLVVRVRRGTPASSKAERRPPMVFDAVGHLRSKDPRARDLAFLPAALMRFFILSTRARTATQLFKRIWRTHDDNCSSKAFASFRPSVSNPSVNHP